MNAQSSTGPSMDFRSKVARHLVRMAAESEGVEAWLLRHGGTPDDIGEVTHRLAQALYADAEDAAMFNVGLIVELGQRLPPRTYDRN